MRETIRFFEGKKKTLNFILLLTIYFSEIQIYFLIKNAEIELNNNNKRFEWHVILNGENANCNVWHITINIDPLTEVLPCVLKTDVAATSTIK